MVFCSSLLVATDAPVMRGAFEFPLTIIIILIGFIILYLALYFLFLFSFTSYSLSALFLLALFLILLDLVFLAPQAFMFSRYVLPALSG